jgi:hypothetical protein
LRSPQHQLTTDNGQLKISGAFMWGNAPGWGISAVMVLATAGMLYYLALPPEVARPEGLIPLAYKPVELPANSSTVVSPGNRDCDAGDFYRQAIDLYLASSKTYQDAVHANPRDLPAIQLLLKARDCGRMRLFINAPQEVIHYNNEQRHLEALVKLGDACNVVGLGLRLDKKPEQARPYFEAAFVLGRGLYDERIGWRELASGLSLMSESAQNLAKLADEAGDGPRVDVLRHFNDSTVQYEQKLQEEVASPLSNPVEQTYGGKYAGDIFDVANNNTVERVWRVEAILHIGRYRYNVADGHRGDQLAVDRQLQHLEQSTGPDLVLHTAIRAAQHLTIDQQQMTR